MHIGDFLLFLYSYSHNEKKQTDADRLLFLFLTIIKNIYNQMTRPANKNMKGRENKSLKFIEIFLFLKEMRAFFLLVS